MPGKTPFLRDLANEIIAKRTFWSESNGFALWDIYSFFGHPFAANPQSEAFYPGNLLFLIAPPIRSLGFYIFIHFLIFISFSYLSFCELNFEPETSLAMSLALGLSGFFASLKLLIVLLSTVSWIPVELFFILRSMRKNWLKNSLLAGLAFAVQIFAGEIEMAGLGWLIILAVVFIHKPGKNNLCKGFSAILLAGIFAILISAPQWLLSYELLGLSNRAGGYSQLDAEKWSFVPVRLREFFLASYIIKPQGSVVWGLGFFQGFHYLLSSYPGLCAVLLALFSFQLKNSRVWFWVLFSLLGTSMAMGQYTPVYGFLHQYIPGFSWFRIPEKFIIIPGFGIIMLAGMGLNKIYQSRTSRSFAGIVFCGAGLLVALLLIFLPLQVEELGNRYPDIQRYFLYRSLLRSSACGCFLLGLIFLKPWLRFSWLKPVPAMILFIDLFLAHRFLNPTIDSSAYLSPRAVADLNSIARKEPYPVRIISNPLPLSQTRLGPLTDPEGLFTLVRDGLVPFWGMYYHLADVRAMSSFSLLDQIVYLGMFEKRASSWLLLARSGVEYFYKAGFFKIPHSSPRASIYYQSVDGLEREQILKIWSEPNFPNDMVALVEKGGDEDALLKHRGLPVPREPARVKAYQNHLVEIEAEAKRDGVLVLLDSYYPGWKAFIDGKEVKIYRANGFFRAVKIPAGRHLVKFSYCPGIFRLGLIISSAGLLLWIFLLGFALRKNRVKR